MGPTFKSYLVTFLLLHLIFGVTLLIGYRLFSPEPSGEIFSYVFLFVIIFGFVAICILPLVYTYILSRMQPDRLLFFISALLIDLGLANLLSLDAGDSGGLTGTLINEINNHTTWEHLSISWIVHVSLVLATGIVALIRPVSNNHYSIKQ